MKLPSPVTLKKYGLSEEDYIDLYNKHDGACHVCLVKPKNSTRALAIEHEHVLGFKKMLPEEKKNHVRGLADWICNYRILTRGVTLERLKNAVRYLEEYEQNKIPK
jgi:hypothetical protein